MNDMKYFKDADGQIYAYEVDTPKELIAEGLSEMGSAEVDEFFRKQAADVAKGQEELWASSEIASITEQLLLHDDDDEKAVATPEAWKEYRKALRRWNESDSADFPDQSKRPKRPE